MHKTTITCILLLVTAGFGHKALAQDKPAPLPAKSPEAAQSEHFYHLDFVVEDVNAEGKVVNSRRFSTTVSTVSHGTNSIRSGSKIPILTGSTGGDTQFQYEDVGASFDIRDAHEVSGQIAFELTTALSSVATAMDPNLHEPVIRENKWQASVMVPIGKQTVVFNSDSVDSKGSTRVLITATSID
jgi:hypothetical protein